MVSDKLNSHKKAIKNISRKILQILIKSKLRFFSFQLIHKIYHILFYLKILKLPNKLIYNLDLFPGTFGDFVHILSIAQALSIKFNNQSISYVYIVYDTNNTYQNGFIKTVMEPIISLLDEDIIIRLVSLYDFKKSDHGDSIFPYIPTFYNSNFKYRPYRSIDSLILASLLDLRVFEKIDINKFKNIKYKEVYPLLLKLLEKPFYCFNMREELYSNKGLASKFNLDKIWDSKPTIKCIKNLINNKHTVVIINPLNQKYDIKGAIVIDESTKDPLLRYFIYINAKKVYSMESGTASLLFHSKFTSYLIYNADIFYKSTKKEFEKELFYRNIDWVYQSDNRIAKYGNISFRDIS